MIITIAIFHGEFVLERFTCAIEFLGRAKITEFALFASPADDMRSAAALSCRVVARGKTYGIRGSHSKFTAATI